MNLFAQDYENFTHRLNRKTDKRIQSFKFVATGGLVISRLIKYTVLGNN